MSGVAGKVRWKLSGTMLCALLLIVLSAASPAKAQEISPHAPADMPFIEPTPTSPQAISSSTTATNASTPAPLPSPLSQSMQLPDLTKRETFSSALQIVILLTVLSLAPAILIMMTSFTRIIIVLALLRQALGTQQLPPNQILIGLALFMTFLVMGPTWQRVNSDALQPYMDGKLPQKDALVAAANPLREFMSRQIMAADNDADVFLFTDFTHQPPPGKWKDVGTFTLIPAFVLSELKTAFLLGFKVYMPFLIIDMVVSAILISMGMMMLPPALISLPFKLLLFVLVDGWRLITGSLMGSFMT